MIGSLKYNIIHGDPTAMDQIKAVAHFQFITLDIHIHLLTESQSK